MPHSLRTHSAGRAPLLLALALGTLALGLTLLAWQLRPGAEEAAPDAAPVATGARDATPGLRATGVEEPTAVGPQAFPSEREELQHVGTDAPPMAWSGTVREASSAQPIEGARVALAGDGQRAEAASGPDGRFELTWPAGLAARLSIEHPAFVDVRAPSVDMERDGEFTLERSSVLRGRVEPPPQGEARVIAWLEAHSSQRYWDRLEVAVGSGGTFELADLDPGDYVVTALVPGRSVAPQAGLHLERGEILELVLSAEPASRIEGLVLRMPQGRGVPGARVTAAPRDDSLPRSWREATRVEATSDERGRYVLDGLGPGSWRLEAEPPWGGGRRRDVDVPESGERLELDFELPGSARLAGRVADATGRGVEGATVVAVSGNRFGRLARVDDAAMAGEAPSAASGPSGAFALDQVPSQSELVLVALAPAPGGDGPRRVGLARVPRLTADEVRGGVEVLLAEPFVLRGIARGSDGAPVADARVEASGRVANRKAVLGTARSGPDGRFELGGLPPLRLALRATHPERLASAWLTLEPSATTTAEIELVLPPAFAVEGLALDTQGFGVAHVPIGLRPSDASGALDPDPRRRGGAASTDDFGRFRITGLDEGLWVAAGSSYEWRQVGAAPAVLTTPGDEFVTVTFAPRERPLRAEIRGEIALAGGGTPSGVRIDGLRGGVLSVDHGDFRATGLVPTRHRLTLRADGHAALRTEAIDLPPGQVHDLGRVVLQPATFLTVRVRDGKGGDLDGARVRLLPLPVTEGGAGEGTRSLRLGRRSPGRYSTPNATRHAWRLVIDREDFRRHARRLEVRAQERQSITVRLDPRDG